MSFRLCGVLFIGQLSLINTTGHGQPVDYNNVNLLANN